jgi:hypothetical protein
MPRVRPPVGRPHPPIGSSHHPLAADSWLSGRLRAVMVGPWNRGTRFSADAGGRGLSCRAATTSARAVDQSASRRLQGLAVASHHSALVLHGLPIFAADPRQVHVTRVDDNHSRSRGGLTVHEAVLGARAIGAVVEPSVAVVQTGMVNGPMASLIAADAALHRGVVTSSALERACVCLVVLARFPCAGRWVALTNVRSRRERRACGRPSGCWVSQRRRRWPCGTEAGLSGESSTTSWSSDAASSWPGCSGPPDFSPFLGRPIFAAVLVRNVCAHTGASAHTVHGVRVRRTVCADFRVLTARCARRCVRHCGVRAEASAL